MSTPTQPVETPFDSAKFLADRNAADHAKREGKEVPGKPEPEAAPEPAKPKAEAPKDDAAGDEHAPHVSRSQRRRENQLLREVGELSGKLSLLEKLVAQGGTVKPQRADPEDADPEPNRMAFQDDASYQRALGRWDARQEANKALETVEAKQKQTEAQREYAELCQSMAAKCAEDIKDIPDWAEAQKRAAEDENQPEFVLSEHPVLNGLLATSDQMARVLRYWADNPKDLQTMLDLTPTRGKQADAFRRLEGKVEVLYASKQKAAQASEPEPAPKDRTHPAEAPKDAGRTAVDGSVHTPRPTSEVVARGGSPAPSEPAIGSREWMQERNRTQFGR